MTQKNDKAKLKRASDKLDAAHAALLEFEADHIDVVSQLEELRENLESAKSEFKEVYAPMAKDNTELRTAQTKSFTITGSAQTEVDYSILKKAIGKDPEKIPNLVSKSVRVGDLNSFITTGLVPESAKEAIVVKSIRTTIKAKEAVVA